jgi:hypothetical protein
VDIKKAVSAVLDKPMDRREFLANAGVAMLTLVGVSAVLKSIGMKEGYHKQTSGYGSSSYGGKTMER